MKIKVGEEYETLNGREALVMSGPEGVSKVFRVSVKYSTSYLTFDYTEDGFYYPLQGDQDYPLHLKEKEKKEPFVFPEGTNKYWLSDRDGDDRGFFGKKQEAIDNAAEFYSPYIVYKAVGYVDSTGEYHKLKKRKD